MYVRLRYFIAAIVLFIIEVLIAVYVHDSIVRPYIGDYMVTILLYCGLQSFFKVPVLPAAVFVLLFSYLVEISQYFHFVRILGLERSMLARVIFGSTFQWIDLVAYTAGIVTVIAVERWMGWKDGWGKLKKPLIAERLLKLYHVRDSNP